MDVNVRAVTGFSGGTMIDRDEMMPTSGALRALLEADHGVDRAHR